MNLVYILLGIFIIIIIPAFIGLIYNRAFVPKNNQTTDLIDFWVAGFIICVALVMVIVISGMILGAAFFLGKAVFQIFGLGQF